jgi:hypothetical protein
VPVRVRPSPHHIPVKGTKEVALSDPSGIAYAIPVDHVRALLQRAGVKF